MNILKKIPVIFVIFSFFIPLGLGGGVVFANEYEGITVTTHFPDITPGSTSARLRGYIKNLSGMDLVAWFEWGESLSLKLKTSPKTIRTSTRLYEIKVSVRKLEEKRSYYYRLVAENIISGKRYYGKTIRFNTDGTSDEKLPESSYTLPTPRQVDPPIVVTNAPTEVTFTDAVLNGSALPRGDFYTNGYFEWGTTSALGNTTVVRGIGSKLTMDFSEKLSGLLPNTRYYFRAVAQNQNGSNWGFTLSFITNPNSPSVSSFGQSPVSPPQVVVQAPPPEPKIIYVSVPAEKETPETKGGVGDAQEDLGQMEENGEEQREKDLAEGEEGQEDEQDEQVAVSVVAGGTFFPTTFLGWLSLTILIIVLVSLLMYISHLRVQIKEAKTRKEEENQFVLDK